jgi:hypothetical protein
VRRRDEEEQTPNPLAISPPPLHGAIPNQALPYSPRLAILFTRPLGLRTQFSGHSSARPRTQLCQAPYGPRQQETTTTRTATPCTQQRREKLATHPLFSCCVKKDVLNNCKSNHNCPSLPSFRAPFLFLPSFHMRFSVPFFNP